MRILLNNFWIPTVDATSVGISRSINDPVPTCSLSFYDNLSSIQVSEMQELLVLDDRVIPNPTLNLIPTPDFATYTSSWNHNTVSGVTLSQASPGVNMTASNAASGNHPMLYLSLNPVSVGQTYVLSAYFQGSSSPSHVGAYLQIDWLDINNNVLNTATFAGPIPASTLLTRYSLSSVASTNAVYGKISVGVTMDSGTNSGVVTVSSAQFEPAWFTDFAYPTPWCGPGQTNCQQLTNLVCWIRQHRKFAGWVTEATAENYHGNARTWQVDGVGYAWILSQIFANQSFTNQYDSAIISSLLGTYCPGLFTTSGVVQGVQLSAVQANWDDLRTVFDNQASQSGFFWTVDAYWNLLYQPPGYTIMQIVLICDNSGVPDLATTFPAYNFSSKMDYTQPADAILVIGSGSNVALVQNPTALAQTLTQIPQFPSFLGGSPSLFWRKINDSGLQSVTDCVNRGIAELLQYQNPRYVYKLSTNVELIPGQSIRVTSSTDNLNATALLIQQVTARWLGVSGTLTDEWEYQSDLGAVNRAATNIISNIFRRTNANSSAPAISQTTLVTIENIGISDSASINTTLATGYAAVILTDSPLAYYRLDEATGTVADDFSGSGYYGTINGGVTLGTTGLLLTGSDKAMTFNGSTGNISLPTALIPTGAGHAWSLECWCNFNTFAANTYGCIVTLGANGTQQAAILAVHNVSGTYTLVLSTVSGDINSASVTSGNIYHVVGTYDGTHTRLSVNGSLVATGTFSVSLGNTTAVIGERFSDLFFPGVLDEVAIYSTALSGTQIATHYAAGTSAYALLILQDTPIAYYRLGEASGTTATDASGNANDGTYAGSGVTYGVSGAIVGDPNTAVTFNGSTGKMTLPGGVNPTSSVSIECWIKMASAPGGNVSIFANWSSNGGFTQTFGLGLGAQSGGTVSFEYATTTNTFSQIFSSALSTGAWHHLVGTYDSSANLMTLYVDGASVGTDTPATRQTATQPFIVGSSYYNDYFAGSVDEPAVYTYALSSAQVAAHYAQGLV